MNKKPTGRPRKEIDQEQFEKLCALHCTQAEICGFFDITEKTLAKWCKETYNETFSQVFKSKSEAGKISLRRYQFELAKKSATMAIFLGKNILGQKDVIVNETEGEKKEEHNITFVFSDTSAKARDGE